MHAFSIFVFATVQRKLSMLHMEKRSRNTLILLYRQSPFVTKQFGNNRNK